MANGQFCGTFAPTIGWGHVRNRLLLVNRSLIGVIGIGAQWVARGGPASPRSLMLVAGILAGPVLGLINPGARFRRAARTDDQARRRGIDPVREGGQASSFAGAARAGAAVFMLVFIGVPVGWALGTAAAYCGAGLPFGLAALFGGVMVVTRTDRDCADARSLNIAPRVKNMLKWEGIVNDPIGALLAVGICSYITRSGADANSVSIVTDVIATSVLAILISGARRDSC